MKVKFGIIADLHTDFIHDGEQRFQKFLNTCLEDGVDFCVQLGDFITPSVTASDPPAVLRALEDFPLPFYHILGNHDLDHHSKDEILAFWGQSSANLSFDAGGIHFVLLDACHYREGETDIPYDHGNYIRSAKDALVPVLPKNSLTWLKKDLAQSKYPAVILSHQSLTESRTGIRNPADFRAVLSDLPQKPLLCICGHEHVDRLEERDGTLYYCLNSASYYWAGSAFDHSTYGEEIEKSYPRLRHVFPYRDPLFAIVSITEDAVTVKGVTSEIVGATPKSLGFQKKGLTDPVTAAIADRTLIRK